MTHRPLTDNEIAILESRECTAEEWKNVSVAKDFSPGQNFRRVRFSGMVELGMANAPVRLPEGFTLPAGINRATLHNVKIGDNCRIDNAVLANVDVGDHVLIEQVDCISRLGDSPFANLSAANVLTEDGGRSVPLWRYMTAQMAHLLCHYKNHPAARALETLIQKDADTLRLPRSVIGAGCRIRRTGTLRNVWIGPGAHIEAVSKLDNCYIDSSPDTPARIGETVEARDCIFLQKSIVNGGAQLNHCLVGEGVSIGGGFSGTHTLFFANAEFTLGESEAVMAGPFATSSHKATLILTCQTSFSTFGSGSNSSNHHFKLGPRHGGVLRRGVKCGSDSYLFWPCDIGAFTTVVGRHGRHMDTAFFPFSLLLADGDKSVLVPGVNVFGAGGFRDERKWRERDKRGGIELPRDLVNPAVLSPYVIQAMDMGCDLLRRCVGIDVDVRHGGAVIPADRIEPALHLYANALVFYLGERLFLRAAQEKSGNPHAEDLIHCIQAGMRENEKVSNGRWRDWCGMLLPGAAAAEIISELEQGKIADAGELRQRLRMVHALYDEYSWQWLSRRWARDYGQPDAESVQRFVALWRKAILFRHSCFMKDAAKEFSTEARIGFGVEEDAGVAFRRVRGTLESHPLVAEAEAEKERLLAMTEAIPAE